MKVGFDFVQSSNLLAGCGSYAFSLFKHLAALAPQHEFLAYRNFVNWFVDPARLVPLPAYPNVSDPLAGMTQEAIIRSWQQALARQQAPGLPDLVHSTSFYSPRLSSSKLVMTVFDLSFWVMPEHTTDSIRLHCQTGVLDALAHADGLIFISEHTRREFDQLLPTFRRRNEIATIVTPLASRWPVAPRPASGPGRYWLFVGSHEPRKNVEGLLDAYEAYARGHPRPLPLWLAGGAGWKNESWQARLVDLEQRQLLRRLGYVPEEALPGLYQGAAALIFPSWYEGFGLPVLEAMTQGCPVICSDRTSLPEVGGDAVHYVDPAMPATIAQAMLRLERDSAHRTQLIERGRDRAANFSWEKTAKQTLAFYDRILANSRSRS